MSFDGAQAREIGAALRIADGSVACAACGHRHGGPGDNILESLRETEDTLWSAGPVRGEDYDRGRFVLRALLCAGCGTLVDTQVAMHGAPRPFMRLGSV